MLLPQEAFLGLWYWVGWPYTHPILLSPRPSSFPLPRVSQFETIYLWVSLELEYKFKTLIHLPHYLSKQQAQCKILGGHSIIFLSNEQKDIWAEVEEGSRLIQGLWVTWQGTSGGTQREGNSEGKIMNLEREWADRCMWTCFVSLRHCKCAIGTEANVS